MREWSLVERVADLMSTKDPRRRGDMLMQTILSLVKGRRSALFERHQEILRLHASSALDREVLEAVQEAWSRQRGQLRAGVTLVGRKASKTIRPGNLSWAIVPVLSQGRLVGALYADSTETRFDEQKDLSGLAHLARMAAGFLMESQVAEPAPIEDYIGRLTLDEIGREQLALLISRHEGNVARIARMLRVTRATVYNRLKKHGLMPLLQAYRPGQG